MNRTIYYDEYADHKIQRQQEFMQHDDKIYITAWYPNGNIFFEVTITNRLIFDVKSLNDEKNKSCILPSGTITVWKACRTKDNTNVYVQLTVPENAKRVTPLNPKFKSRVEFAQVIDIIDEKGNHYKEAESSISIYHKITYKVGETVYPDKFNGDAQQDCTNGIHVHLHKEHCDQWFAGNINDPLTKYGILIDNCFSVLQSSTLYDYKGYMINHLIKI